MIEHCKYYAYITESESTNRVCYNRDCYYWIDHHQASKWLRTLTRYVVLSWMLCMRCPCPPLRNKYPTLESMQQTGFLLQHEAEILAKMEQQDKNQGRFSLYVINWALLLIRDGRERGFFENPNDAKALLDPITNFKKSCSVVLKYQITAIPLSLIQVLYSRRPS